MASGNQQFEPMEIEALQRGISISGHYYYDGELELASARKL